MASDAALVKIALRGNLTAFLQKEADAIPRALTQTFAARTRKLRDATRGQILAAGLGTKVAKAIKEVYAKRITARPYGFVYSKAIYKRAGGFVDLLTAFQDGARVVGVERDMLAIPTRDCPTKGNRKARPSDYPRDQLFSEKFKGGHVGLFIKQAGRGHAGAVLAWVLVRESRVPRKLQLRQLPDRISQGIAEEAAQRIERLASAAGRAAAR